VCLAIPGRVVEVEPEHQLLAVVDVGGVRRNVNVALLEIGAVAPGDWVLVHVGFALGKIDEAQAQEQLQLLRALGEDRGEVDEIRR
jgi:hydrogenase expression/formation protein HypC